MTNLVTYQVIHAVIYELLRNGYNNGEQNGSGGRIMGMYFDKVMVNPNIPRTIRFTQPLYDWLMMVKERENLSFNQVVLQCCKNSMVEDNGGDLAGDTESKQRKPDGKKGMQGRDM